LREGPVRVANVTWQLRPPLEQVAAVVGVYHDSPLASWSGATRSCTTPNGSNAFGQPFQPSSVSGPSVAPDHVW
jgi:hypothetical protein